MLFETKWYGKPLFVQMKNMVKQGEPHHVLCQTLERETDRQTDRRTDRQREAERDRETDNPVRHLTWSILQK